MNIEKEEFRTFRGYALANTGGHLTPSMEDYLEMAFRLSQEDGFTRVNDLARSLNVKPPSVTNMIQRMYDKELICYEKYGVIQLTPLGKQVGRFLLKRHFMLEFFFRAVGVPGNLLENVERIEHNLTSEATECLSLLVEYIQKNPDWFREFQEYRQKHLG
jgi:Mn-dependent DtxR family transcriptional regulator